MNLKRTLGGAAVIGLAAALLPLAAGPADAAPGPQPAPALKPDPIATAATPFSLDVTGNVLCGGTGTDGWRVHSFIVNDGVDISTLDFTQPGLPAGYVGADFDATDATISAPLVKGGEAAINILPAADPAGLIDKAELAGFTFDPSFWTMADGLYQVGFACLNAPGVVQEYWTKTVLVDANASPNAFMRTPPPPPPVDHYKCYKVKDLKTPKFVAVNATLADQFESKNTTLSKPTKLCNPVDKNGEGIDDPTAHLVCYQAKDVKGQAKFVKKRATFENQLGSVDLEATAVAEACVPSTKNGVPSDLEGDSFKCYKAKDLKNPQFVPSNVNLVDQFESKNTTLSKPATLCNPVDLNGTGISNADNHLVCYQAKDVKGQAKFVKQQVTIDNVIGHLGLEATGVSSLCVPSSKTLL